MYEELKARLRTINSKSEWRVASPDDGSYCIAFDYNNSLSPERSAQEWLDDHKSRFPDSQFAGYKVTHVIVKSDLEEAAEEAADAIEQLERQLAERNAEIAKYRDAPCVAYATTNEEDDLTMLFFDEDEARKYSSDDEPIKLIVKPGEQ